MNNKLIYGLCLGTILLVHPVAAQTTAAQPQEALVLPTFDVTEAKPVGYGTTNALGATRMNLAIKDTPNSIVILNRELMDDLGTLDGLDILKYASGVAPASTRTINVVTIRGEEVRPNNGSNFLDGLPGGGAAEIETEFVDRIEFVKGPAGTLYGSHSLGGLINRVSKRSLPVRQTTLKATFDSVGSTVQGSFDTTGPLGDSGLSYRAIGVVRDGETQVGVVDNKEALYLYGAYAAKNSPGRVWGRYTYQHIESGHEASNWFYDGAGKPSSFLGADFLSVPLRPIATRKNHSFEAGFETQLKGVESMWNIRTVLRFDQQSGSEFAMIPLAYGFYDAAGNLLGRTGTAVNATQPKFSDTNWTDIRLESTTARNAGPSTGKQYGGYLDVVGDFETGIVKHKLLIYSQLSGASSSSMSSNYSTPAGFKFSVIHPQYFDVKDFFSNPVLASSSAGSSAAFNFGVQDNLFLFNDRLIVVGGARYDHARDNGSTNRLTGVRSAERVTNNWVYKAGLVFKPLKAYDGVSLFYNYSETFTAQAGTTLSGIPFKDIEGTANEVGVKLELLKQGIVMTASVFKNENTNFPIRVLNPALGLDDFLQIGTGISKGWEADIAWQPRADLTFMFAVSDVESKNPNGLYKRNVQNGANYRFVGKYSFSNGPLDKLSVGAALVTIAERAGENGNSFFTAGYETVDVFASYPYKRWRFQANLNNLFDGDGVESSIVASLAQVQRPRSIRFSAQYSF